MSADYRHKLTGREVEVIAASGGIPGVIVFKYLDTKQTDKIPADVFHEQFSKLK